MLGQIEHTVNAAERIGSASAQVLLALVVLALVTALGLVVRDRLRMEKEVAIMHAAALQREKDHAATVATLQRDHADTLARLADGHTTRIDSIRVEHARALGELHDGRRAEVEEVLAALTTLREVLQAMRSSAPPAERAPRSRP